MLKNEEHLLHLKKQTDKIETYQLIEAATNASAEGFVITDARQLHNPIIFVNDGFVRLTGYSKEEILGKNCRFLQGEETNQNTLHHLSEAIRNDKEIMVELLNYRKDGTTFWNRLSITPIKNALGETTHFVGIQSDITELKETKEELTRANKELEKFHREMTIELEQAQIAQEFLLPGEFPEFPQIILASKYVPFSRIGGDFFDIVKLSEKSLGLLIADVTGHGIPAALLSFMTSITFKNISSGKFSTEEVLRKTNKNLFGQMPSGTFISMFYLIYDVESRELCFSQAGHPPGYLISAKTGEITQLITEGTLVGIFPNDHTAFEQKKITLSPGDKIVLYTDAIIEAFSKRGELLHLSGLEDALNKNKERPIDQLLEQVYQYGLRFSGKSSYDDDATLVGFEVVS